MARADSVAPERVEARRSTIPIGVRYE